MKRSALTILVAAAVYGFSIGSVHSPRLATWNLVKFPLLLFATALICAFAYHAATLLVTRRLTFRDVTAASLRIFADLSVLLASLAPVSYFLARTVDQPTVQPTGDDAMHEYPFFLGLNVAFIATCGTVALVRQALRLMRDHALGRREAATVVLAWLAISLFTGGQCAWVMRPFFGPATIRDPPFMEGTNPHYDGSTSFYEAVWRIVQPRVRR